MCIVRGMDTGGVGGCSFEGMNRGVDEGGIIRPVG